MVNKEKTGPKLTAFLVCDSVITDKSNKNTLVGVFGTINATHFPAMHPEFVVFLAWLNNGYKGEKMLDISIKDPDGELMEVRVHHDIRFEANKTGTYGIFSFKNVPFPRSGRYMIETSFDGKKFAELPVDVRRPQN